MESQNTGTSDFLWRGANYTTFPPRIFDLPPQSTGLSLLQILKALASMEVRGLIPSSEDEESFMR